VLSKAQKQAIVTAFADALCQADAKCPISPDLSATVSIRVSGTVIILGREGLGQVEGRVQLELPRSGAVGYRK